MLKSWPPLASYWTRSTRLTLVLLTLVSLPSSVFAQLHEPTDEVALESAADMPPPTFFTRPQYRGTAVALPVGDYALADLVAHGMADNTISSLHVAPGFKVEAFANGDFTGTSIIVSGDTPALAARQFDNQLSSVRISQIAVGATFYEFCERGGYAVSLPVGQYTRQRLARWGIGNNQISEVVPARNTEVEIFDASSLDSNDQPGVIATSRLIRAGVCLANVSGGFDNKMSSVRIRTSAVQFRDNFSSRSLANWEPLNGHWEVTNGRMVGSIGFDSWALAAPNRNFSGPTVLDVDVEMVSGNARYLLHGTTTPFERQYTVDIHSRDHPQYANRWQVVKTVNFEHSFPTADYPGAIDAVAPSPIPIPRKCHYTVRRIGNKIDVYVNWVRIGSVVDASPLPADGKVGLGIVWDFSASYDNFVVRN